MKSDTKTQFYQIYKIITGKEGRLYTAIVLACGFLFAVGLCLVIKPTFEYSGNRGVVSWISANKYPKQQEMFYYIGSLIFIPIISMLILGTWVVCLWIVSSLTRLPVEKMFRKYAFTYIPFVLILWKLKEPTFSGTLLLPIILIPLSKILFLIHDLLYTRLQNIRHTIFYKGSAYNHWSVITCGICAGLFAIIVDMHHTKDTTACIMIIAAFAIFTWLFWLIYSRIINTFTQGTYSDIINSDAITYIPITMLLASTVLYQHKKLLLLLSIFLFLVLKIITLAKSNCFSRNENIHKYFLEYLILPAIIYAFFYSGGNIHGNVDMFHEGERLAPLNALLRGKIPYRDIYLQHGLFHNAGRPLLAAKLFGTNLAADRILGHLLDPLRHVAIYILCLQAFRTKLFAILAVWITASGKTYDLARRALSARNTLAYASLAIVLSYALKDRRRKLFGLDLYPFLAGTIAMLNVFYSLEMGFYTLASGSIFLLVFALYIRGNLKIRLKPFISYAAGAFVAFLPFGIYFVLYGALDDMLVNWFIQTYYHIPTWGLPFPSITTELAKVQSLETLKAFVLSQTFEWYLPVIIYIISLIYLLYKLTIGKFWGTRSNVIILLLVISGVIFFRTPLGRSDLWHLYGISFAWLIIIILSERLAATACRDFGTRAELVPAAFWKAVLVLLVVWHVNSLYHPLDMAKDRLATLAEYEKIKRDIPIQIKRIGPIEISKEQADHIKAVIEYIQENTKPDEAIFDFSNQGSYYFFVDRPMVSRYHQVCYASAVSMQEEVVRDLERDKTRIIISRSGTSYDGIDGVPNDQRHAIIARYLDENYVETAKVGNAVILMRKE
ncbi:hypothetical protein GF312_00890 [Candidatus Poribacteria bacterium]|nr:hypothetical protein [Candidatus Poribacteria bacterium]